AALHPLSSVIPNGRFRKNELKPRAMPRVLQGPWRRSTHSLSESWQRKSRVGIHEINWRCMRRWRPRTTAPSRVESPAAPARAFHSDGRAADCLPAKLPSFDPEAALRSIHVSAGAHLSALAGADLRPRAV